MSDFTPEDIALYIRRDALTQIEALEKQQARALREYITGRGGAAADLKKRLEDIDDQIAALRSTLST